jgi:hypothetical protein
VERSDAGEWVAVVTLSGVTPEPMDTTVRWSSVVIVAPTTFAEIPATAPLPGAWPKGARQWLGEEGAADETAVASAHQIRGGSDDALAIVRRTVDHLRHEAPVEDAARSTWSKASRVARLLRANGIPARLVAGVPAWAGATGERWLVEAFMPWWSWYSIEPSLLRAPWPNHQFVRTGIVPISHESRTGVQTYRLVGLLDGGADRICEPVRNFPEDLGAMRWEGVMRGARSRWGGWLAGDRQLRHRESAPGPDAAWFRTATSEAAERSLIGE